MIEVGGINLAQAVIDLEVQVATQSIIIDNLIRANNLRITQAEVDKARDAAFEQVKAKYPKAGLTKV
ncbi:hypothetical protein [Pedobacter sp.]|uniref:hypothetical protein n=1 Tax=Pedobacter sp. TaxID=1411316 RepID=UPI003BAA72B1